MTGHLTATAWLDALDPARVLAASGFRADPWQVRLLRSTSPRLLVRAPRQSGKSLAAGALLAHTLLSRPGSTSIVTAAKEAQAQEMLLKVRLLLDPYLERFPLACEATTKIALKNGARCLALSGNPAAARSYSPNLVVVDEAAYSAPDLLEAILPAVLVTKGRVVAISNAGFRRGWYFDLWQSGDWERISATFLDNPRADAGEIEKQRLALGDAFYSREHMADFADDNESRDLAFGSPQMLAMIERAFSPVAPEALNG